MNKLMKLINLILESYSSITKPIKASIWFTICSFLQKGIAFLTVPLFSRLLTTDQYGMFNVYQSWLSIISVFATLNLSSGVFYNGMLKYEKEKNEYISSMQGLSTCVTFCVFLIFFCFYNKLELFINLPFIVLFAMFIDAILIPAFNFWSAKQKFEFKYKNLVLISLLYSIMNPTFGILAILFSENKGIARILSVAFVEFFIYGGIYLNNIYKGKKFFDKKYWKFALSFNIPLVPHYLSQIILGQSDRIMINYFCGTDKAGIYSIAFSVAMIMNVLSQSIISSLTPWIYQKIKKKEYLDIEKNTNFLLFFLGTVILIIVLLAPEIISIIAPPEYYEAIWIVPAVALNTYFMFVYELFSDVEFYFEKNLFVAVGSIIAAVANIILNYIFIRKYGFIAAGYTSMFCYFIYCLAHYIFMKIVCRKFLNHKKIYNEKIIFIITLILLFCSFLIMLTYKMFVLRYIIIIFIIFIFIIKRKLFIFYISKILKKQ